MLSTYAFCYDSRPTRLLPLDWYISNAVVGGFANSNIRRLCNAKFETFDDQVFAISTKPIAAGEEIFVFYKVR